MAIQMVQMARTKNTVLRIRISPIRKYGPALLPNPGPDPIFRKFGSRTGHLLHVQEVLARFIQLHTL